MKAEFNERLKDMVVYDFTSLGGFYLYFLISLFFLIRGSTQIFLRLAIGITSIYLIVVIIKTLYYKERPLKLTHSNYIEKLDASSFPSLHAARSAYLNLSLAVFFNALAISITLLMITLLVCYSRLHLKKHDLKDVSAGIIVGIIVYYIINYFFR